MAILKLGNSNSSFSGSFSGSFGGDGSGLTNLAISHLVTTGSSVSDIQDINGSLKLTGDITAQNYIVSSSVTYMTQSFSSGSTIFGDTLDDTHQFTGSLLITGSVTASYFVGDGTNLTGITSDWDGTHTGDASITGSLTVRNGSFGSNYIISPSGANTFLGTVNSTRLTLGANYGSYMVFNSAGSGFITSSTDIVPTGNFGHDFGSVTNAWNTGYFGTGSFQYVLSDTITAAGDIVGNTLSLVSSTTAAGLKFSYAVSNLTIQRADGAGFNNLYINSNLTDMAGGLKVDAGSQLTNVTASGDISSSGTVYGTSGSFHDLTLQSNGTSNPRMYFNGSADSSIYMEVGESGSVSFKSDGSGSLWSVTDSLSGSLFDVTDVSGLPILEVFSDDRIIMGAFNKDTFVVDDDSVTLGSSDTSGSIVVRGIHDGDPVNSGQLFYTSSDAFGGSLGLRVLCISEG